MKSIFKLTPLLEAAFPDLVGKDNKTIEKSLSDYYTSFFTDGNTHVKVDIDGDLLIVEVLSLPDDNGLSQIKKVTDLYENGKFNETHKLLDDLLVKYPSQAAFYRLKGQLLLEQGNQDEATNYLIDALRWNPKDEWSYVLLGNIYINYHNDEATALKFYNQALEYNKEDSTSISNIGVMLFQKGKYAEGEKYLRRSLEINPKFVNSYYVLAISKLKTGLPLEGFEISVEGLRNCSPQDKEYYKLIHIAKDTAKDCLDNEIYKAIITDEIKKVEKEYDRTIILKEDNSIGVWAKMQLAETYHRKEDYILSNGSKIKLGLQHLILHELHHLILTCEARKINANKLFTSNETKFEIFFQKYQPYFKKLQNYGVDIREYAKILFDGINIQVFNVPVDLFIENRIYDNFPLLRPLQFISLYDIVQEGIDAVNDKKVAAITPPQILSKSRIYNLVLALLYRDLYGIDRIADFNAHKAEMTQAEVFYNEFLEYKEDTVAGEEYELAENWARDLGLLYQIGFEDEEAYHKRNG